MTVSSTASPAFRQKHPGGPRVALLQRCMSRSCQDSSLHASHHRKHTPGRRHRTYIIAVEHVRAPVRRSLNHTGAVESLRKGEPAFVRSTPQLHAVVQAVAAEVRADGIVHHKDRGTGPGDSIVRGFGPAAQLASAFAFSGGSLLAQTGPVGT